MQLRSKWRFCENHRVTGNGRETRTSGFFVKNLVVSKKNTNERTSRKTSPNFFDISPTFSEFGSPKRAKNARNHVLGWSALLPEKRRISEEPLFVGQNAFQLPRSLTVGNAISGMQTKLRLVLGDSGGKECF